MNKLSYPILSYPFLLVDAARNTALYRHFSLTRHIANTHANLACVSRKFYITFSPALAHFVYSERDRLTRVHEILMAPVPDIEWSVTTDWHDFCLALCLEEDDWLHGGS
jgi:hypothetical protein